MTNQFPDNTPVANPLFYRSYSRPDLQGKYETWEQTIERSVRGLKKIGNLTDDETEFLQQHFLNCAVMPSGRWLWCGGTSWADKPENVYGSYNCSATAIDSIECFGDLMNLAMQGCGTGAGIEEKFISELPIIINKLNVVVDETPTTNQTRLENTETYFSPSRDTYYIHVGDSRQGWVASYMKLIKLATDESFYLDRLVNVVILTGNVRPAGQRLQGFGGVSNPTKLPGLYNKVANILNKSTGKKLTAEECCLLIDEAALVVVAGNIRRSSGIKQFDSTTPLLKANLWTMGDDGKWSIDPDKDALRMSNHTRVYHKKPGLNDCIDAVRNQYESGEGAIQWVGEAIARGSADLLDTPEKKKLFIENYNQEVIAGVKYLIEVCPYKLSTDELINRINRYLLNPCGEIGMYNNFCNLSEVHLNRLDPFDFNGQVSAFTVASISAGCLLHHRFDIPKYQYSREIDPIVGVSVTGLFDFFVNLFGINWLRWWQAGRPYLWTTELTEQELEVITELDNHASFIGDLIDNSNEHFSGDLGTEEFECFTDHAEFFREIEKYYLSFWKNVVFQEVGEYCNKHNLKTPNRCTTIQPAGSKSLLTNASPGWHPPKAPYYIRRITYAKNDPGALACLDMGYKIVPSQSDKDVNGNLLNDPYDPNCTEWLVEIPVKTSWADLDGVDDIDIDKFSVAAQFDFYMQVQKHYTTHNTSATFELRESEITSFGTRIYEAIRDDEGYISGAILARFDDKQTFPRLPFEPISKETYQLLITEVCDRKVTTDFQSALERHSQTVNGIKLGDVAPSGCDSDACLLPDQL